MGRNLETRINQIDIFKSAGERQIAEVLDKYGISYKYESPVSVNDDQNKARLWYPDFYLPTFGLYVEYYGFKGNPNCDSLRVKKEQVYKDMGLEVLAVDASVPLHQFDSYLLNGIYRVQRRRFEGIRSSIYGLRTVRRAKYR